MLRLLGTQPQLTRESVMAPVCSHQECGYQGSTTLFAARKPNLDWIPPGP